MLLLGVAIVIGVPVGVASADGLSHCIENQGRLKAEAETTIELIRDKTTLGPYEGPSTVLEYVDRALDGAGIERANCAELMVIYEMGRVNGTIRAPEGPGLN